jgi:predicted histidine transporter YuiF (NhaC family)
MDGQHDHMKDSVIPTFIHFNIPLMIFVSCVGATADPPTLTCH